MVYVGGNATLARSRARSLLFTYSNDRCNGNDAEDDGRGNNCDFAAFSVVSSAFAGKKTPSKYFVEDGLKPNVRPTNGTQMGNSRREWAAHLRKADG